MFRDIFRSIVFVNVCPILSDKLGFDWVMSNESQYLKFIVTDKWRTSFLFTNNTGSWHPYSHAFRYNPNGVAHSTSQTSFYAIQSNYMLSNSIFFDIKYSNLKYSNGYFVYEDPTDPQYVNDIFFQSIPGFFTGGQEKAHSNRETMDHNFKFDFNWQLNKYHNLKSGVDLLYHQIQNNYHTIQPHPDSTDYHPFIFSDTTLTTYNDVFDVSRDFDSGLTSFFLKN